MSRVEPKESPQPSRRAEEDRRKMGRTPDQAEGDEGTVDEALRHQDEDETLRLPRKRS